ncbi:MAG: hypothetical protein KDK07_02210 [Bauldia sp.]|nr:hypothetical protein [Bauldia sp.]
MSLSRLAMRIAAARALKGATFAEARVFDSAIDPIDQTIAEARAPVLIVTTDDHEIDTVGRDLMHGDTRCELVIEAAIASRVEVSGDVSLSIPHTDEGMEIVLDLIEHQVMAALTRERTAWSRVWMKLVPRIHKRSSRRGASVEHGVRFAARQIVLSCDLIEAPTDGAPVVPGSTWEDVLAVMSEDMALSPIADLLRVTIEGQPLADWRRAANALGIHLATADAIGIGLIHDLAGDPEALEEIRITGGPSDLALSNAGV